MELSLIRHLLIPFLNGVVRGFLDIGRHIQRCRQRPRAFPFSDQQGATSLTGLASWFALLEKPARMVFQTIPGRGQETGKTPFVFSEGRFEPGARDDCGGAYAAPSGSSDAASLGA